MIPMLTPMTAAASMMIAPVSAGGQPMRTTAVPAMMILPMTVYRTALVFGAAQPMRTTAEPVMLVVVGDKKGRVGYGFGKALEVPMAIEKATKEARRNVKALPMAGRTLVHEITGPTAVPRSS